MKLILFCHISCHSAFAIFYQCLWPSILCYKDHYYCDKPTCSCESKWQIVPFTLSYSCTMTYYLYGFIFWLKDWAIFQWSSLYPYSVPELYLDLQTLRYFSCYINSLKRKTYFLAIICLLCLFRQHLYSHWIITTLLI